MAIDASGVTGVACYFGANTNISGSASFQQETKNIVGAASAVVTIQVTTLTITNTSGKMFVNGVRKYLNDIFTITLDGTGAGSFLSNIQGDPTDTGTVIYCIYTIQGVTIGYIGTPNIMGISKVF